MRLIYRSEAGPELDDAEFADLVAAADEANRLNGIAAVIGFEDGHIVQSIDGPSVTVLRLFDRIRSDPRHAKVELRMQSDIPALFISEWGMRVRPMAQVRALSGEERAHPV